MATQGLIFRTAEWAEQNRKMVSQEVVVTWCSIVLPLYINGKANFMVGVLSRDHHLSPDQLVFLFWRILSNQMTPSLRIYSLMEELTLWICSLCPSSIRVKESSASTLQKQVGSFDRWWLLLSVNGIEDEWLSGFCQEHRTRILSAFAGACRRKLYWQDR